MTYDWRSPFFLKSTFSLNRFVWNTFLSKSSNFILSTHCLCFKISKFVINQQNLLYGGGGAITSILFFLIIFPPNMHRMGRGKMLNTKSTLLINLLSKGEGDIILSHLFIPVIHWFSIVSKDRHKYLSLFLKIKERIV